MKEERNIIKDAEKLHSVIESTWLQKENYEEEAEKYYSDKSEEDLYRLKIGLLLIDIKRFNTNEKVANRVGLMEHFLNKLL